MTKYDNGDDDGDNCGNKDRNNNNNVAVVLVSDGLIFDPITALWLRLGLAGEDQVATAMPLQPRRNMYLYVGLYCMLYLHYKDHIKDVS